MVIYTYVIHHSSLADKETEAAVTLLICWLLQN